jgi:hypothetical protein
MSVIYAVLWVVFVCFLNVWLFLLVYDVFLCLIECRLCRCMFLIARFSLSLSLSLSLMCSHVCTPQKLQNIWVGVDGAMTPVHYDEAPNLFLQV